MLIKMFSDDGKEELGSFFLHEKAIREVYSINKPFHKWFESDLGAVYFTGDKPESETVDDDGNYDYETAAGHPDGGPADSTDSSNGFELSEKGTAGEG